LYVECIAAAERSGLLPALEKMAADSTVVHSKEDGTLFRAEWFDLKGIAGNSV
jgi:hypothetical protein